MKLPESVQIGPYTLRVSRDRSHIRGGDLGCCKPSDGLLVVADELSPQETVMTFLHEVAHMYSVLWERARSISARTGFSGRRIRPWRLVMSHDATGRNTRDGAVDTDGRAGRD